MANSVNLKLTNHGLRKIMTNGAKESFAYFSLGDMNELYQVSTEPNLSEIMNVSGSKTLFTARKSCIDSVPTQAQMIEPPIESVTKTAQRWVINFYKQNCGSQDYNKSNLSMSVNLHEYFAWLIDVANNSAYTESLETSINLIQGIYLIKQEQNFVSNIWSNVSTTNNFSLNFRFKSSDDRDNYLKLNSKYVSYNEIGQKTQIDNSFDRFYTSLLFGFGNNIEGGRYLEGHNAFLTFQPPQFGYVVNGKTNFIPLNKMTDPDKYETITPAVILDSNKSGLYYLTTPLSYPTQDINGFMSQAIWGYKNSNGQSLIEGMIAKAKNHIEFYFKETSVDKWELPINANLLVTSNQGDLPVIGGSLSINFVYDLNATLSGYNNILIIN